MGCVEVIWLDGVPNCCRPSLLGADRNVLLSRWSHVGEAVQTLFSSRFERHLCCSASLRLSQGENAPPITSLEWNQVSCT